MPSSSVFSSPIVAVLFEPGDSRKFTIHRDVLIKASPCFAELLARGTNKSQTYEVTTPIYLLDEVATGFVHWAYRGAIDPNLAQGDDSYHLARSWQLAEHLRMTQYQNRIVDALIDTCWKGQCFKMSELLVMVSFAPKDSGLSRLVWDQLAYDIADKGVRHDDKDLKLLFAFVSGSIYSPSINDILHTIANVAKCEDPMADRTRSYETEHVADPVKPQVRKRGRQTSLGGTTSKRPKRRPRSAYMTCTGVLCERWSKRM